MISESSVRRAIDHLGAFSDTDLFPPLPETRCFIERPGMTAKDCIGLNVNQYKPVGVIETLTPKSWLGFRIAHQLTASDNVIYLAALLDCAPYLEAARLSKDDNEAFAYRFEEGERLRIFEPGRGYHQWLAHLSEFGSSENPFAEDRPAIITDIADFYQRIYFHRIENVLQDAGCPRNQSELVKKIIKTTRARQSYGLPVGSTASRLLAECVRRESHGRARAGDLGHDARRFRGPRPGRLPPFSKDRPRRLIRWSDFVEALVIACRRLSNPSRPATGMVDCFSLAGLA